MIGSRFPRYPIDIQMRLPGESDHDADRRQRRELKESRRKERHELKEQRREQRALDRARDR